MNPQCRESARDHQSRSRPARSVPGLVLGLVVLTTGLSSASADDRAAAVAADRDRDREAEAEAAALVFVRENHPELADLLASLKPMRPDEYRKAVRELAQTSRTLAQIKPRDPKRYALALGLWKARSRVELLTARLAATPPGPVPDLEDEIRKAVQAHVDAEIRLQRFERDQTRERLKKLEANLATLETRRETSATQRAAALLRKADRARRKDATARNPTAVPTKSKSKTKLDPSQDSRPGARQP